MGKPIHVTLTTPLAVADLHYRFREVTGKMASRAGSLRGNKLNYFTPGGTDLKRSDAPSYDVSEGATIPTLSGWHGGDVTVHIYIRDLSHAREVLLYAPHGFGGRRAAAKAFKRVRAGLAIG